MNFNYSFVRNICRLSWLNHLDIKLINNPSKKEERDMLHMTHYIYGTRWIFWAKLLQEQIITF